MSLWPTRRRCGPRSPGRGGSRQQRGGEHEPRPAGRRSCPSPSPGTENQGERRGRRDARELWLGRGGGQSPLPQGWGRAGGGLVRRPSRSALGNDERRVRTRAFQTALEAVVTSRFWRSSCSWGGFEPRFTFQGSAGTRRSQEHVEGQRTQGYQQARPPRLGRALHFCHCPTRLFWGPPQYFCPELKHWSATVNRTGWGFITARPSPPCCKVPKLRAGCLFIVYTRKSNFIYSKHTHIYMCMYSCAKLDVFSIQHYDRHLKCTNIPFPEVPPTLPQITTHLGTWVLGGGLCFCFFPAASHFLIVSLSPLITCLLCHLVIYHVWLFHTTWNVCLHCFWNRSWWFSWKFISYFMC